MGERGPAPAPTALKVLKGEKPSRINRNEPKPEPSVEVPVPPDWMTLRAIEVWNRLAPDLHAKGVLTPWDLDAFATYCETVIHLRDAHKAVDEEGVLIRRATGTTKHPALQVVRDQATILKAYAMQFGLTPSSRSNIEIDAEEQDEAAQRLLS